MRPFSAIALLAVVFPAVTAQAAHPTDADWMVRPLVVAGRQAFVRMPGNWIIREDGIAVPEEGSGDCQIHFLPERAHYDDQLAAALESDRGTGGSGMQSELSHAGKPGGIELVSVSYRDQAGKLVEKRYFRIPGDDGATLLEWSLRASANGDGRQCAAFFTLVARSFGLSSKPATSLSSAEAPGVP